MFGASGDYLFHYTTADTAFGYIPILPSGLIRMSPYTLIRDPMEAKDWRFTSDIEQLGPRCPGCAASAKRHSCSRDIVEPGPGRGRPCRDLQCTVWAGIRSGSQVGAVLRQPPRCLPLLCP